MTIELHLGDCLDVLCLMPDNSVDSIVTDPPYGIGFMGQHWDHGVPGVDFWREMLRVLKPGGHLLSFAGTRTQHRMACNIEDAGFEIRDMIAWVYGSGFPKSLDVSKAIDKAAGVEFGSKPASGVGFMGEDGPGGYNPTKNQLYRVGESTKHARQWQGWGTALKPALEPITVARKPLAAKTVAANVMQHGTGGINIEACRVPLTDAADAAAFENNHRVTERLPQSYDGQNLGLHDGGWKQRTGEAVIPPGRWPANLIHDGSDEVVAAFPESKRQQGDVKGTEKSRTGGEGTNCYGEYGRVPAAKRGDAGGSAARFFYSAKASRKDRGAGNDHPTVKPTDLMAYLCRLVTPPGGVVLDPFMGSGSTGKAAVQEGFRFIGIEREADYMKIAAERIYDAAGGDLV